MIKKIIFLNELKKGVDGNEPGYANLAQIHLYFHPHQRTITLRKAERS